MRVLVEMAVGIDHTRLVNRLLHILLFKIGTLPVERSQLHHDN